MQTGREDLKEQAQVHINDGQQKVVKLLLQGIANSDNMMKKYWKPSKIVLNFPLTRPSGFNTSPAPRCAMQAVLGSRDPFVSGYAERGCH